MTHPDEHSDPLSRMQGLALERQRICCDALNSIPNEQIERDKKLYPHVAEMREALQTVHDAAMQRYSPNSMDLWWSLKSITGEVLDKLPPKKIGEGQ